MLELDGGPSSNANDSSRAAELGERHARIDEELLAALERWEELGALGPGLTAFLSDAR